MRDERFEELLRDAAQTYNRPPDLPPLEEMWAAIERASGNERERDGHGPNASRPQFDDGQKRSSLRWHWGPWLRMAAILVLGMALGRASVSVFSGPVPPRDADTALQSGSDVADWQVEEQWISEQYLGQTAALLIALPVQLEEKRTDSTFTARADDLLLQTRLLLDSPTGSDPLLRTLLEDLEVVLVQVVRLQTDRDPLKIDLLNEALEQREVLSRLRSAVIGHIGD